MNSAEIVGAVPASGRRIHYGWWVVVTAGLVFFVQSGLGSYLPGVLQPAWLDEFGWQSTWITLPVSLGTLLPGLTGVQIGRWTDRFGPRWIIIIGTVLTGLSYVLLAGGQDFPFFFAAFALGALGRCGTSQVPASAGIARWFVSHRARAMGWASTGISLAGIVLVPLTTWLVLQVGWRVTVVVIGVGIWLLIIPMAWRFMGTSPASLGLKAYGEENADKAGTRAQQPDSTLSSALHGWTFWLVAAGLMLGQSGSFAIGIHAQKAIMEKGASPPEAAFVISLLAGSALVGRFGYSWLGDQLPSPALLAGTYVLQALGFTMLGLTGAGVGVWIFAVVYGSSLGGSGALQPVVVADLFGVRAYGAILGAIGLPAAVLSALTPLIAAAVRDLTGNYAGAFLSFALVTLIGAACFGLASRIQKARLASGG